MNDKEKEMAVEWILEQSTRIATKIVGIIENENKNELKDIPCNTKRVTYNMAIFQILKLINFPVSIMFAKEDDEEFLPKYEEFAETLKHNLSEICEVLYHWEPNHS